MSRMNAIPGSWNWEQPYPEVVQTQTANYNPMTEGTFAGALPSDYNPFQYPSEPVAELPGPSAIRSSVRVGETARSRTCVNTDNKQPIVIAVFGMTGTGKTSFIKAITGEDLVVGHNLTSCTEDVLAVPCKIDGENVVLVDTPGFSDTNLSDTEILKRIATWMKDTYDDGSLLSGIVYLHRIIDPRMEGPSLKNLRMMKKLCGSDSLKNVLLATSMWEKVTTEEGSRREEELKTVFWKDMIAGGSRVERIMTDKKDDAYKVVKSLLRNKPMSTRLQQELRDGKTLSQTDAGAEIRQEFARLEQRIRSEFEDSNREMREALRNRDRETERQVKAEMDNLHHKMALLEVEKRNLESSKPSKTLPRAKREGLFGFGRYRCLHCKSNRKTDHVGRWKCKSCHNEQRNVW